MDDFDERISALAKTYWRDKGNSVCERDYIAGAQAARGELPSWSAIENLENIIELLKKENEALRAEIKTYSNKNLVLTNNLDQCYRSRSKIYYDEISTRGQHDKLAADNAAMREALEFYAYDVKGISGKRAREVLSAIGEVGEK